jgi:hypothetical protein
LTLGTFQEKTVEDQPEKCVYPSHLSTDNNIEMTYRVFRVSRDTLNKMTDVDGLLGAQFSAPGSFGNPKSS